MGGAEQRLDILLDPEDLMPDHVSYSADAEHHHAESAQLVAQRDRVATEAAVAHRRAQLPPDPSADHEVTGVEQRMPRSEERLQPRQVVMRPAVDEQSDQ
ncbi:MAG: hypothetical protein ACRDS1_06620 [Pseudonocardiaceae bacterium]